MDTQSLGLCCATAAILATAPAAAAERTFEVGGFSGVSVSAGIVAEIAVGPASSVRAEGTDEGVDRLDVFVKGDELVIRRKPRSGMNWGKNRQVTVYVTTPSLSSVDASSGSQASASNIDADSFSADVSSGASADLTGVCGSLSADGSSGASLDATGLQCESVVADASSGASLRVHASKSLAADASSGGSIRVSGAPQSVNTSKSSGGSVSVAK